MSTWGEPLRECPSLIDFLTCMYDILEGHRWAVMERNIIHRDISLNNILVRPKDFKSQEQKEFAGTKYRPIFANEILEDIKDAGPTACLGDLDNAAELDRAQAVSHTFVSKATHVGDAPLRCRMGAPKFIARSPTAGRLLIAERRFAPMPELPDDLAAKYTQAYPNDRSGLRALLDNDETYHGGVFSNRRVSKKYHDNRRRAITEFRHRPCHDAESVFWCMVVSLLGAVPLGSPQGDPNESRLNHAWKLIASHEVGDPGDVEDRRFGLLRADEDQWKSWLHPYLDHVGRLLVLLAEQVSPEWGLCDPPPHMLHLHEAMQRIILQHIAEWKKDNKDVKFYTGRTRLAPQ